MTVTFENEEFIQRDIDFFLCHKPQGFLSAGRKRKAVEDDDIKNLFTKVKVQSLVEQLSLDVIKYVYPRSRINSLLYTFISDPSLSLLQPKNSHPQFHSFETSFILAADIANIPEVYHNLHGLQIMKYQKLMAIV